MFEKSTQINVETDNIKLSMSENRFRKEKANLANDTINRGILNRVSQTKMYLCQGKLKK